MLFDAKAPAGATLPGGNGVAFDWRALDERESAVRASGGLTPDTVAEAIRLTGATLVDVSSGVERAPARRTSPSSDVHSGGETAAPQARAKAS